MRIMIAKKLPKMAMGKTAMLWMKCCCLLIILNNFALSAPIRRIPLVKIELDASLNSSYFLVRCRSYGSAYSAAWLAPIEYLLSTKYPNKMTLEWHSHNLYMAVGGKSYKIEAPHEFK